MNLTSFLQSNKRLLLRLGISLVIFLAAASLFGAIADEVHEGDTTLFDQSVLRTINDTSTPALNQFFLIVTEFGGVAFVTIVSTVLFCYLLYKKQRYNALLLGAGVGGAALINYLAKITFVRERPDLWEQLITETTYSFPSGHAAGSAALAICVAALLWRTKWQVPALIVAPIYIVLIGFSRMYLGVHYLTDIFAGWILSIAWVTLVIALIYTRKSRREIRKNHTSTPSEPAV